MSATLSPPLAPRTIRWTRDEYHRLADQGFFRGRRVELVGGEVIEMSPMREPHAAGIALTAEALRAAFGPGFYIRTQVPLHLGDDEPEPDVAVVPGSPRDYAESPTHALLIVEIAESSFRYDTTVKASLYARAGIRDYWVMDLERRQLLVFREPFADDSGRRAYRSQSILNEGEMVVPDAIPSATIRIVDLLP